MSKTARNKKVLSMVLVSGLLFASSCGITTLQLRDFVTSSIIRTTVTTAAAVLESAIIAAEQEPANEAAP